MEKPNPNKERNKAKKEALESCKTVADIKAFLIEHLGL